ncbi:MAG: hypothetical protein ACI9P8_001544 [Bacteroidia bacterium]|jgi:hypothetical protein
MTPKYILLTLFILASSLSIKAQSSNWFLDAFDAILDQPTFLMSDEITADVPKGGHLQGIQVSGNKVFISGSSNDQAYLAVFKGHETKLSFIGLKVLSEKPYTHAGGFQIDQNWLAVGCEDPVGKKASLVVMQEVSNAAALAGKPSYVLQREGQKKLATAGAVALLKREDHFLLAVASWNAATIDFYTSNHLYPSKEDFEFSKWTTWDKETSRHRGWVDKKAISYQNIQLFEDSSGVYLIGTGINSKGSQLADVFSIDSKKDKYDMMVKVRGRVFNLPGSASFRNGAGFVKDGDKLSLWTIGKHLKPKTFVAVFPSKN